MPRQTVRHYGGSLALGAPRSNGAVSAVTAASAALSPGAGSFTYAWWMSPPTPTGLTEDIVTFDAFSATGWAITSSSTSIIIYAKGSNVATFTGALVGKSLGWHRWALVADASDHSFYLYCDSVLVGHSATGLWSGSFTASGTLGLNRAGATIGGGLADATYDVGTAWSAAQVASDYYQGQAPATITHRWPLDDGAGTTTARATLGGLPLTLAGGAAWSADSPMLARASVRNLYRWSTDTSRWIQRSCSTLHNTTANPIDGAVTADTQSIAAGTSYPGILPSYQTVSGLVVHSIYAKRGNVDYVVFAGDQNNRAVVAYNMTTGAWTIGGNYNGNTVRSYLAEDVGNGWIRISVLVVQSVLTTMDGIWTFNNNNNTGGTFTGSEYGYFYAPMMEPAAPGQTTASPYVATGAAPLSVYGMRAGAPRSAAGARTAAGTRLVVT